MNIYDPYAKTVTLSSRLEEWASVVWEVIVLLLQLAAASLGALVRIVVLLGIGISAIVFVSIAVLVRSALMLGLLALILLGVYTLLKYNGLL